MDTPPSRSALDFLDAPQRLSSFMDGRMIKLLATPSRGVMKIVGAGFALFSKAVTTVLGGQMLQDAAQFVQLFEDMFGGFRQRAQATYELLRATGTKFVVVSICEADSLREASYFADRLRAEHMPLAGLILNRTHPPLAELPTRHAPRRPPRSCEAKSPADRRRCSTIHTERLAVRAAELHMRARFDRVHTDLPVIEVPALPSDAHDLPALREIGRRLTAAVSRAIRTARSVTRVTPVHGLRSALSGKITCPHTAPPVPWVSACDERSWTSGARHPVGWGAGGRSAAPLFRRYGDGVELR